MPEESNLITKDYINLDQASLLPILTVPHETLKKKAVAIDCVDASIQILMHNMLLTMYQDEGIGLAANQVGALKRVIVIDNKVPYDEGCLSVPGEKIDVIRPKSIELKYLDFQNRIQKIQSSGLLARVIQHEIDHLDGKTILDYVSKLRKERIIKKLSKI